MWWFHCWLVCVCVFLLHSSTLGELSQTFVRCGQSQVDCQGEEADGWERVWECQTGVRAWYYYPGTRLVPINYAENESQISVNDSTVHITL